MQYSRGTLRGVQTHQHTPTHTFRSDPVHMFRAEAREGKCAEGISVAGSIVKVCMADCRLAAGVGAVGKPQFHRTKQGKSHKSPSRHRAENQWTRQQGKGLRAGTYSSTMSVSVWGIFSHRVNVLSLNPPLRQTPDQRHKILLGHSWLATKNCQICPKVTFTVLQLEQNKKLIIGLKQEPVFI